MKPKTWIVVFLIIVVLSLGACAITIFYVDPFFHYHKPHTDKFFYTIDNERSQNDGIIKHFDYEGLITGTSMCENFRTSEAEALFGCSFIKVPFSGGSYKEVNDNIDTGLHNNSNLRVVIRGLDMNKLLLDKDSMRLDLGEYPTYLYDDNLINDVKYLFNIGIASRAFHMMKNYIQGKEAGTTSFDSYANWMRSRRFGVHSESLYPNGVNISTNIPKQNDLTEEEKRIVEETVEQNIVNTARDHPDVDFYYFFTPYSAVYWKCLLDEGAFERQIQAERVTIEKMLEVDNIKLFSINNRYDLITDLNNYKDNLHYGEWINSLLLRYMHDGKYRLTRDNYVQYLAEEEAFYKNFDYYTEFSSQEDYENDYHAAEVLQDEIYGTN